MKKFLLTILALILSFACLAGCSSEKDLQNVQTVTHENISFQIPDDWNEDKTVKNTSAFYPNKDSEEKLFLLVWCIDKYNTYNLSSIDQIVSQFQSNGSIPEDAEINDIKIDGTDGNLVKFKSKQSMEGLPYCKEIIFCDDAKIYIFILYSEKESVGNSEIESIAKSIKISSSED